MPELSTIRIDLEWGWIVADLDKIAERFRSRHHIYVAPTSKEERAKLIEYLEEEGFELDKEWRQSRDEVLASIYPISIYLAKKSYIIMGNMTCAAGACSGRIVASEKEFYKLYAELQAFD